MESGDHRDDEVKGCYFIIQEFYWYIVLQILILREFGAFFIHMIVLCMKKTFCEAALASIKEEGSMNILKIG